MFFLFKILGIVALVASIYIYFPKLTPAASTSYYVSPNGDDANTGLSPETAWKTINKVNNSIFQSGDKVLFEGGKEFSGSLYFDSEDTGTAQNPVTITSYGTGKSTINSGSESGAFIYNSGGFSFSNLNFVGAGASSNTNDGLSFYMDLGNNQKLDTITLDNIDVSGYGKSGASLGSWNNLSGYKNIRVANSSFHDNKSAGFGTYAQSYPAHENVFVTDSKFFNNLGDPSSTKNTGSGIVLGSVSGGTVERSLAYNNGVNCFANECGVGIWAYDSNNITFQFNESYSNKTSSNVDGDGFDFDQNVSNSVMQYNYSHDNDGAGFLIAHSQPNRNHKNNTIRYNISQNDSRKLATYGAIHVWGGTDNTQIYNNTIYMTPNSNGFPPAIALTNLGIEAQSVNGFYVRNNNLITTGGSILVDVTSPQISTGQNIFFQGNNYYSSGNPFKVKWGSADYSSLVNWQSATNQEKLSDAPIGLNLNPQLNNPGGGGTINNPNQLTSLTAYQISPQSPIIESGLDLSTLFSVSQGTRDFYGNILPKGNRYDVGAHEFPNPLPSPSPSPSPTITYLQTGSVSPTTAAIGTNIAITSKFTSSNTTSVLVDVEVYGSAGRVFQSIKNNQSLVKNTQKTFSSTWATNGLPAGTYKVYHGLWTPNWGNNLIWNEVATVTLTANPLQFTLSGSGTPLTAQAGTTVKVYSSFKPNLNTTVVTNTEIWSTSGKVFQSSKDNDIFTANTAKKYTHNWNTAGLAKGTYTIYQGVWTPGWGNLIIWKEVKKITLN